MLFTDERLKGGETVLVHAAVGGVATFVTQFAYKGALRVFATASGDGVAVARRKSGGACGKIVVSQG